MDRVDSFRVSESDLDKVLLVLLGNLLGFRVFLLSIAIAVCLSVCLFVCHCALFFPELKALGISSACPELFVNLNILVGT